MEMEVMVRKELLESRRNCDWCCNFRYRRRRDHSGRISYRRYHDSALSQRSPNHVSYLPESAR
ncbi:hypothetical protein BYT27DRAFT_7192901 [Phlegmacium glaucopus]|nr:hypothetical protein BYT27DRAFT_7192901 [Phlegmacium glaucopus]